MLMESMVGGLVSAGGMVLLYEHLPPKLRAFVTEHEWMIHGSVAYITWIMHQGTFTGTLAAGFSALFTAAYIRIQKDPEARATWLAFVVAFKEGLRMLARALVAGAKGFTTLVASLQAKADQVADEAAQAAAGNSR